MTDATNNSPLPLLLSTTGAILAVAGGGWYLLNQEPNVTRVEYAAAPVTEIATLAPELVIEGDATVEDETAVAPDIDAELRKARLAADADILVLPASQSALYYYGRVLKSDPQHSVALAGRDLILSRAAQIVQQHLTAEDYEAAFEIATVVARQNPGHSLVVATQTTLDGLTESLVADAITKAEEGKDGEARSILASAEALPGRNPKYFAAINEALTEIKDVRQTADLDRKQRAKLANSDARAAWVDRIEVAIASGNLISPAGASAHDLLSERNNWNNERAEMSALFLSAVTGAATEHVDNRQVKNAEALLGVADTYTSDPAELQGLYSALDDLMVDIESNRIASMNELAPVNTAQPRYPDRARKREQSGWVDVYFTVTKSGDTGAIEVNQSDPKDVFDRAAIKAVEKWVFEPVEYRGRIIDQRAAARLVFRLE